MEVILKKDLAGLGLKDDLVPVRPGYGRNYLIPKGLAMVANAANKKIAQENIRQAAHKMAQRKQAAEAIVVQLQELAIEIKVKAGEKGKIFGSVTTAQLAQALREQNINVDHKTIGLVKPIRELGEHEAIVTLHKEIVHTLKFKVTAA